MRKLKCRCCNKQISEGDEGLWESSEGIFCSQECIAAWHGDEIEPDEEDFERLVKRFGTEVLIKPELSLCGEDGNAFSILGRAFRAAKKAGWTEEQTEKFKNEATAGDYDHLLQTCMKYFEVD